MSVESSPESHPSVPAPRPEAAPALEVMSTRRLINYTITTPDQVAESQWEVIQKLEIAAGIPDVATDFDRYVETRRDPNALVGNELLGSQEFREPHVVFGKEDDTVVGYLYTALNISGSGMARFVKRTLSPTFMASKEFIWTRTIAVDKDARNLGVGRALMAVELGSRDLRNPTTAYVVKDDDPTWYEKLRGLHFEDTSPEDVTRKRLQARSRTLKRELINTNDAKREHIRRAMVSVNNQL